MTPQDLETEESYLWDGGGNDKEVEKLEALLAPMRHQQPIRRYWRRAWLSALLLSTLIAGLFFVLYDSERAPARFVGLFHDGPVTEMTMRGGTRVELAVDQGSADRDLSQAIADVMAARDGDVVITGEGQVFLELPEYDHEAATVWANRIVSQGRFSLQLVLENTEFMKKAYALAKEEAGIEVDIDQWYHDDTGREYADFYLKAPEVETLVNAFNRWIDDESLVLPEDAEIAFEEVIIPSRNESYWRSYYIRRSSELQRSDIQNASVYWNPTSNKPEVLIEFTELGGRLFGEFTSAVVGRKVAMMIDGQVMSAPTVQTGIYGGSTSISMGGSDPQAQQAEAQALAAVLSAPPLPADVSIRSITPVSRSVSAASILAARVLMAFGIGLFVFGLAWPLKRWFPLQSGAVSKLRGVKRPIGKTFVPALVSLGAVLAAYALSKVWLPGAEDLLLSIGGADEGPPPQASVVSIGIMPFLTGAVLADLIAWLVPSWRKRRGEDSQGRVWLEHGALLAGLALLVTQAYFVATWMARIGTMDNDALSTFTMPGEPVDHGQVLLALIVGSSALYGIAKAVGRWGLGNGFAVVLGATLLPSLPDYFESLHYLSAWNPQDFFLAFALLVGVVLCTAFLLRRTVRVGGGVTANLPAAGIAPLVIGPTVFGIVQLASLAYVDLLDVLPEPQDARFQFWQLVTVVFFSILITAFALRTPQADGTSRVIAGLSDSLRSWRMLLVIAVSVAFPITLLIASRALTGWEAADWFVGSTTIVLATGVTMDLVGEFRARWRNPELVAVWEVHRPRYLQPMLAALEHAGIDAFVRARHMRVLLSVLGPFAPMVIMVPQHRADEARELIESQI